jgi:hypothetical protein
MANQLNDQTPQTEDLTKSVENLTVTDNQETPLPTTEPTIEMNNELEEVEENITRTVEIAVSSAVVGETIEEALSDDEFELEETPKETEKKYAVVYFVKFNITNKERPSVDEIKKVFSKYGDVDHIDLPNAPALAFVYMKTLSINAEGNRVREVIKMVRKDTEDEYYIKVAYRPQKFKKFNYNQGKYEREQTPSYRRGHHQVDSPTSRTSAREYRQNEQFVPYVAHRQHTGYQRTYNRDVDNQMRSSQDVRHHRSPARQGGYRQHPHPTQRNYSQGSHQQSSIYRHHQEYQQSQQRPSGFRQNTGRRPHTGYQTRNNTPVMVTDE